MYVQVRRIQNWFKYPFVFALAPVIETLFQLLFKNSIYMSMGGVAVSDSSAWLGCIKSLASGHQWPVDDRDWCMRRPLYPILCSIFFKIFPSINFYFIFISILCGVVLYKMIGTITCAYGKLCSTVVSISLLILWWEFAATQTMSEQFGLIFSLLSLNYFTKYTLSRRDRDLLYFSFFIFMAQLIRPGNFFFFIFPVLLLFLYSNSRMKSFLSLIFGVLIPFLSIIFLIRKSWGISNFLNSGNSWATLYGLQHGNNSWGYLYSQIPSNLSSEGEIWGFARESTVASFVKNPFAIPKSMLSNIFDLFDYHHATWIILATLAILFLATTFTALRNKILPFPIGWAIGFVLFTEILTYGFSAKADPIRTMSTSTIYLVLMLSMPMQMIIKKGYASHSFDMTLLGKPSKPNDKVRNFIIIVVSFGLVLLPTNLEKSASVFSESKQSNCSYFVTIGSYPSSLIQAQNIKLVQAPINAWWGPILASFGYGTIVSISARNRESQWRKFNLIIENVGVNRLKSGQRYCVSKTQTQNQNQIGFFSATLVS